MLNLNFFGHIASLVKMNNEVNRQKLIDQKNASVEIKYKILSTYDEYCAKGKLLVQSRLGSSYAYMTPEEICSEQFIISHLHPLDVNAITKIFFDKKYSNKKIDSQYKLLKQRFSEINDEPIYTLYNPDSDTAIEINESKLLESSEILSAMNGKDGVALGFAFGMKCSRNQRGIF